MEHTRGACYAVHNPHHPNHNPHPPPDYSNNLQALCPAICLSPPALSLPCFAAIVLLQPPPLSRTVAWDACQAWHTGSSCHIGTQPCCTPVRSSGTFQHLHSTVHAGSTQQAHTCWLSCAVQSSKEDGNLLQPDHSWLYPLSSEHLTEFVQKATLQTWAAPQQLHLTARCVLACRHDWAAKYSSTHAVSSNHSHKLFAAYGHANPGAWVYVVQLKHGSRDTPVCFCTSVAASSTG